MPAGVGSPGGASWRSGTDSAGQGRWPTVVCLAASLGGGLCLALSLPPFGLWPLAWLGAALFFLALRGQRPGLRLAAGELAGLGCFVPGLWWTSAFNWYGALVLMVVEAASLALAGAVVPARRGRWPAFVGACTLAEELRMHWPFGGLPLGGVFLGQAAGPLLPVARLGGPIGLTMVVWAIGATLGTGLLTIGRWYRGSWLGLRAVALVAVPVLALAAAVEAATLAPDGGPAVSTVRVVAVQGGGRRGFNKEEVPPATVFAAQVRATELLAYTSSAAHRPELVVWPEDVISLDRPLRGSRQAATMASFAEQLHATVVAGVTVTVSSTAFRNEAAVWAPDGRLIGTYEKVHRVPFGEYVPDRGFFAHFASLSAVPLDAIPGHSDGMLRTPAGRVGIMLSYEVFYAERATSPVRAGATLLLVPTNTSSYATSQVPSQEVAADRVEAVATGRDLVQASPTGYSTVVSSNGVVRQRSGLGRPDLVAATVARRRGFTVFDQVGDLPVLVASAVLVVVGWAMALAEEPPDLFWRRRERRRWHVG